MSRINETRNRKAPSIDSWEDEMNSVLRDPARSVRFSAESVQSDIRGQPVSADDGIYAKVSLNCPLGRGSLIEIPVRGQDCTHLQCFDLATYLKMHDRTLLAVKRHGKKLLGVDATVDKKYVSWDCPICKARAEVEQVEVLSDGSRRPIVQPKVEVFPISDSPFIFADSGEAEKQIDEKPLADHQAANHLENDDGEDIPANAMEITDLTLQEIQRLPETHQMCKAVKRRLLNNFTHMEKKKAMKEPDNEAPTTTTLAAEGSGADNAQISGGGAEDTQLSSDEEEEDMSSDEIPYVISGSPSPSLGNRRFTKQVVWQAARKTRGTFDNYYILPCGDRRCVLERTRSKPDKSRKMEELKANVQTEVGKMGLDETVINRRNTLITRIEFPQLPIWITDGLRALQSEAVDITLTHVFICLGFDLKFRYSGSTDMVVGMVVGEIERMIEWWKNSIVGKDVMRVREDSAADVSIPAKIELPRFILFTIPEVGDWSKGWKAVNESYRKWAADYNRCHPAVVDTVQVLDWAKMCEEKWGEEVQYGFLTCTFEKRVKLLMEHCIAEYGMLLERRRRR